MNNWTSYPIQRDRNDNELLQLSRKIETGFPSPAGDHLEKALNLEELIVLRPTATFYVRVEGNAMRASGIYDGDILVVDRSLNATDGSILVVTLEEEILIRRFIRQASRSFLVTDDTNTVPIPVDDNTDWMIWGVVTHLVHRFR